MASVTSSEVQCSTYIWARAVIDYSGTSATAHIQYRHSAGGYQGYYGSFTYGAGGASASGSWNNEYVGPDWTTKMSIGFSISQSGGTYNVWCSGYSYNAFSVNVSIPAQQSAPTGLTCSNIVPGASSFSALVTVSDWGVGGTTSGRYRELQVWTYSSSGLVEPRRYQPEYGSTLSSVITVNNSSDGGSLTIIPNTRYVIGVYATNGAVPTGAQRIGAYYTICEAPTFSEDTQTRAPYNKVTVSFDYTTPVDGGALTKTLYYSLDNLTWTSTGETISSGSQTSGTFTITLPADDSSHTVYLRTTTSAGNSTSTSISVHTLAPIDITFNSDFKDTNPESVAITGNDHLFIYNQSVLQFTIDNIRSENYTYINTIRVTINNRNFTGSTTWTTDSQGVTTNNTPVVINYGTVDFEGDKTATVTVIDLEGNSYSHTHTISVLQRAKIDSITYSFNDKPYYLTSTMTVGSWYGASQKAIVKCRLYWTGDNGQLFDYTVSDYLNVQPWISLSPSKWSATTSQEVPQVTSNTQFTVTIDLTEESALYSGTTPWQWILDKARAGNFDSFNIEWSIETENGVDTKSVTNLSTPANYEFKLVKAVEENGILTQVIRDVDIDLVRFLNDQQLQRNKDIRRLFLVNSNE